MDDNKLDEATLRAVMKYCSDRHAGYSTRYEESHDICDVSLGMAYFDVWEWCYKRTEGYRRYEQSLKGRNNGQSD